MTSTIVIFPSFAVRIIAIQISGLTSRNYPFSPNFLGESQLLGRSKEVGDFLNQPLEAGD